MTLYLYIICIFHMDLGEKLDTGVLPLSCPLDWSLSCFCMHLYTMLLFSKDYREHTGSQISSQLWAFLSGWDSTTHCSFFCLVIFIHRKVLSLLSPFVFLMTGKHSLATAPCMIWWLLQLFSLPCFVFLKQEFRCFVTHPRVHLIAFLVLMCYFCFCCSSHLHGLCFQGYI